jgi:hypothetical protein
MNKESWLRDLCAGSASAKLLAGTAEHFEGMMYVPVSAARLHESNFVVSLNVPV